MSVLTTLRARLGLGFLALLGALGLSIAYSHLSLRESNGALETLYGRHHERAMAAASAHARLLEVRALLLTMMTSEPAKRAQWPARITEVSREIDAAFDLLLPADGAATDVASAKLLAARGVWRAFRDTRDRELIPLIEADRLDEARAIALGVQRERFDQFSALTREAVEGEAGQARALIDDARARQRTVELVLWAVGAGALLTALLLGLVVKRATDRVQALTEASRRLGGAIPAGESHDEIGQLVASFTGMVEASSRAIDTGAKEVQRALSELAAGSAEQSTAVSEVVTTLDQLRAAAVSGSDRSREVLEQSRHVRDVAHRGGRAVEDVIKGMGGIRKQVEEIATCVLDLSERAQRIGEIVESVSGIADQSKLLSLNASIEAAKAGEYGQGFAVVADEVRALAERSQAATREIGAILKAIQKATNSSVMATEDGSKAVDRGLGLVDTARTTIETLSGTVEAGSRAVEQIAVAAAQQSQGVTQINEAMSGILAAVRQGSAESSRIQAAIEDLVRRVTAMNDVVARFRSAAV